MSQALEWLNNGQKGPAPVTALGGASGLAKGRHQFITATFEPGTYVLLCFIPDATDFNRSCRDRFDVFLGGRLGPGERVEH